ncbi:MAG: hypothetical protein EOP62_00525 [Sphingomonadales bacterium]|nr:MAG: hypothetical protein EOP62_00525 [Sphingomonadales bacterium]
MLCVGFRHPHSEGFPSGSKPTALVILIQGTEDDVAPFRSMDLASTTLIAAGVKVETHASPGMGHSVGQDRLAAATAFALRVLG